MVTKRRIPYEYDIERRKEAFRRRYLTGFGGLVMDAAQGEIEPLIIYLDSEKSLSSTERELLTWLIRRWQKRGIPRRRGRPPGHAVGDKQLAAAQFIASKVDEDNKRWRAANSRRRAPKGRADELIRAYIEAYQKKRPDVGKLDPHYVRTQLKHVSRK